MHERIDRIVHQAGDVELIHEMAEVPSMGDIVDCGGIEQKEQQLRDIELPSTLPQSGGANDEPAFNHHPGIDQGGRVTGNEYEEIGSVAEPVIPGGEPGQQTVRHVA